jgi:beta-glucosidase
MPNRKLFVTLILVLVKLAAAQAPLPSSPDVEKKVNSILNKMTLEEKIDYIGGFNDFYVRPIPRLGLPAIKMSDGPIGVRNYGPATTMAGGIALAATWDADLLRKVGAVFGDDSRARGVHILLGPGVNIYRAPMAGRDFEYFGEDPFLAARTAVAYVEGLQSKSVCATIKHYMGNNQEYDRHNVDSLIDERTMREIYLPTFEAAVKQGHVCAIMDSYNLTNGQHMSQNGYLNNDIAKKDWGFDGIIMSDWDSTYDGVAAVNGGLDLEMPSGAHMNRATLLPAIKAGKVSEATIDDHVRRILRKAVQFGWLDREQADYSIPVYNIPGRAVALEAARSSMVLLKNDGNLLPFDKSKMKTLAVIGPDAYPGQPVGGGSAGVRPFHVVSFLEGVANHAGEDVKVTYAPGLPTLSDMADGTDFVTEPSTTGKPGLKSERFVSNDLTGKPAEIVTDVHVNFGYEWPSFFGVPSKFRSVRWTGYYVAKEAGKYEAFVQGPGEDGAHRLFVDDKLVVDNWSRTTALVNSAALDLSAGAHKIRLELRRTYGDPNVRLGIVSESSVVSPDVATLASKADAVVVAVGFDSSSESEGADRTFRLPPGQDALIQAVLAANKNAVVVITSGGAVDMNGWVDRVPVLLEAWYPGQEGGTALAQLLFGETSPSGKLPVSFERRFEDNAVYKSYYADPLESKKVKYTEGVFVGYRHFDKSSTKPLFPFGYGLSYTTFTYSRLSVTPQTGNLKDPVTVLFDVTNSGAREGAEVAEVYVGDAHAGVPRPVKELKGFAKLNLKPGETRRVMLTLDRRAFSYYDVQGKDWKAEPGEFTILVGGSSDNTPLKSTFTLNP